MKNPVHVFSGTGYSLADSCQTVHAKCEYRDDGFMLPNDERFPEEGLGGRPTLSPCTCGGVVARGTLIQMCIRPVNFSSQMIGCNVCEGGSEISCSEVEQRRRPRATYQSLEKGEMAWNERTSGRPEGIWILSLSDPSQFLRRSSNSRATDECAMAPYVC